jgi:D-alanine-D-alanine ligase
MKRKNIAIIFGGKSAEHEVSVQSAKNVYLALDKKKIRPILVGIAKSGKWFLMSEGNFLSFAEKEKKSWIEKIGREVVFLPAGKGKIFSILDRRVVLKADVVFPVLHGPFGEDGTVQGLLKIAEVPFVGPGVLAAAVGMDKVVMKRLLREAKIPVADFLEFRKGEKADFDKIKRALGMPFFVKPVNLGSSVGISKVAKKDEFKAAMDLVFRFDSRAIIEKFIEGREIECSAMGNESLRISIPGEVVPTHDFYSYEAKYLDEKGAEFHIPAKLSKKIEKEIRNLAAKSFRALCCDGMGRIDFFLVKNGKIFVNEINTIPGFTKISMFPKLFEVSGVAYPELIEKLIDLGIERFNLENSLETSRL